MKAEAEVGAGTPRCYTPHRGDGGRAEMDGRAMEASGGWTRPGRGASSGASGRNQPDYHLGLNPVRLILDF